MVMGNYFQMIESALQTCDSDIHWVENGVWRIREVIKHFENQVWLHHDEEILLEELMRGCYELEGLLDDIRRNKTRLCDMMRDEYIDLGETEDTANRIKILGDDVERVCREMCYMCNELSHMPNISILIVIPKEVYETVPTITPLIEMLNRISVKTLSYTDALRKDLEKLNSLPY